MDLTRKADREILGERMAELRRSRGLTQQLCADALGVGQSAYAQMESGVMRFRRRDLVTLAVLFGMTLEEAFPAFAATDPVAA